MPGGLSRDESGGASEEQVVRAVASRWASGSNRMVLLVGAGLRTTPRTSIASVRRSCSRLPACPSSACCLAH
jgi:hypothetical protein